MESKHGGLHSRIVSPTQSEVISVLIELSLKGLDTNMAVWKEKKRRKEKKRKRKEKEKKKKEKEKKKKRKRKNKQTVWVKPISRRQQWAESRPRVWPSEPISCEPIGPLKGSNLVLSRVSIKPVNPNLPYKKKERKNERSSQQKKSFKMIPIKITIIKMIMISIIIMNIEVTYGELVVVEKVLERVCIVPVGAKLQQGPLRRQCH